MGTYRRFADVVRRELLEGGPLTDADTLTRDYFRNQAFTGSRFELMSDTDHPDEITPCDLVAVSTLGVNIPAPVAVWLLGNGRREVTRLLADVPPGLDLWDAAEHIQERAPLWRLWRLLGEACWPELTNSNGMGRTKISKLLAAKRPRLVPISDNVVRNALPRVDNWWAAYLEAVQDPEDRLLMSIATGQAPPQVGLLRRIDVVIWMRHRRKR